MREKIKIIIVGNGFGGTYTLKNLHKFFCEKSQVEISLVGEKNYFLFTPLLHEVATGAIHKENIVELIEEAQKSRSELLQILESKNQEFLDSLPKNIADLQILIKNDGVSNGEIRAALPDENIFVAKHYYGFDYMDPQFAGNVLNVERKSNEVVAMGHAENVEADGEIFTIDGYGATKEEALAKALEIAAEYMGTNVFLDSNKNTENQSVSYSGESERTAAHYIKSYKKIGSSEEERLGGEKFYNVQIEVQPGKIAQPQ